MPFQPPKARIESLVNQVLQELQKHPNFDVADPNTVRAAVRGALTDSLRAEWELEQEVLETLQKHGQIIYKENADFHKMLQDGKKMLARKKGFTL